MHALLRRAPALVLVPLVVIGLLAPAAGAEGGDSTVLTFGTAGFHGSPGGHLNRPLVAMAATPTHQGYWLVGGDGGVFTFGDAGFFGSAAGISSAPVVGIAPTPTGHGYWLGATDGGVFSFGDAGFFGSAAGESPSPVVAMAATASGQGYWLARRDGSVAAFGDASVHGLAGGGTTGGVVAMAATPSGQGYWLAGSDGSVAAFGDALFAGSVAHLTLARPVSAIAATPTGLGYWLAAGDGGTFAFGDAPWLGSAAGQLAAGRQVVAVAGGPAGAGYWLLAAPPAAALGAVGPGVAGLQQRLVDLGFWGPVDGRFGPLTTQQVYAFQKANGLPRDGRLDGGELGVLERAGRVRPRSTSGYVVEVDKRRQLLIVARDGHAEWVFNTSTGNNRRYGRGAVAVTPEGRFSVQRQINGLRISPLGALFRPKYFTGGYAIHGSPSVPPFPASHGCVRLTNAAINFVWDRNLMPIGTPVWVYS